MNPRLLLLGNPNVGKSVLFQLLTGRYVAVSNYPGTTVEITQGNLVLQKRRYSILDTPGVNTLIPTSEDEQVTRDILLQDSHESVIQVADAKNLWRGLLISLELAEMGVPFLLVLNMDDEARSRGVIVDTQALAKLLGVEVLSTVATRKQGLDNLRKRIPNARPAAYRFKYSDLIEDAVSKISGLLPETSISTRSVAIMLLAGDTTLHTWIKSALPAEVQDKIRSIRARVTKASGEPLSFRIQGERSKELEKILPKVVNRQESQPVGALVAFGRWALHPVWGIPILAAVLYFLFYKFVGVFGAGTCVDILENQFFNRFVAPASTWLIERAVPWELVRDMFVGEFGLITMGLSYAVAIVLPIVATFFVAFGLMEDSGYLPRLAVLLNSAFRAIGLNGKAVLPMVLGFGCDTMATLSTRILDTKRERLITMLLLALGIPCSAQLGVILGFLGGVGPLASFIWIGVILAVLLAVGALAARALPGERSQFMIEIPPIRVPRLSNVFMKTVARIEWYLKEAVPLFLLGTLVLFVLDRLQLLQVVRRMGAPLVTGLLGLPEKAADALLIGFLRRDYGAAGFKVLYDNGEMDATQTLVAIIVITLFMPCIANLFMIVKERGWKTALAISAFVFPLSFAVGGAVHFALDGLGVRI